MTEELFNKAIELTRETGEIENYLKALDEIDKDNVLQVADIPQINEIRQFRYIPIPKSLQDGIISSIQQYYKDKLTDLKAKFEIL